MVDQVAPDAVVALQFRGNQNFRADAVRRGNQARVRRRRAGGRRRRSRRSHRAGRGAARRPARLCSARPPRCRPRYRRRRAHRRPACDFHRSLVCLPQGRCAVTHERTARFFAISGAVVHPLERLTMQVRIAHDAPAAVRAGALVVPVFADGELNRRGKSRRCRTRRRHRRRPLVRRNQRQTRRNRHSFTRRINRSIACSSSDWAIARNSSRTCSRVTRAPRSVISDAETSAISRSHFRRKRAGHEIACRIVRRRRCDRRIVRYDRSIKRSPRSAVAVETRLRCSVDDLDATARTNGRRSRHGPRRSGELRAPSRSNAGERHDADDPRRRSGSNAAKEAGLDVEVLDEARARERRNGFVPLRRARQRAAAEIHRAALQRRSGQQRTARARR